MKRHIITGATDELTGALWEVSIIGWVEDIKVINEALLNAGIDINIAEAESRGKESSVYVSPNDVAKAVKVINGLGYETDED